jgi:hypothetical protein
MPENDDTVLIHYDEKVFPYHADCYSWPKLHMPGSADILNVHCIRDMGKRRFALMGFVGVKPEDQITAAIYMAQQMGPHASVIMFRGVGLDDDMMNGLMMGMEQFGDEAGSYASYMPVAWPTRFQVKVLREAEDMSRHGNFHETSMAYRLKATPEEIHYHLEVLSDLGLMARE